MPALQEEPVDMIDVLIFLASLVTGFIDGRFIKKTERKKRGHDVR